MIMRFFLLRYLGIIIIILLFAIQILYIYAFFIEPYILKIDKIKIASPSLYKAFKDLKIVHISDIHFQGFNFITIKLVNTIKRLQPDIIFISGDIISSRKYINQLWDFFSLITPHLGTYIVFGESDGCIKDLKNDIRWKKNKVYNLEGEKILLNLRGEKNSFVWLVGCYGTEKDFVKNLHFKDNFPKILLSHRPDIIKYAALKNFDLVLAGHTHGSQVGIPILRKFFSYSVRSKYISGLYRVRNTLLFVNRGIFSEKHLRLFCPPQLAILEFTEEKTKMKVKTFPEDA